MDQPSVDRQSGDGVKLDYSTSIRPEEPRWKRIMEREGTDLLRAAAFSISLILLITVLLNSFFSFAISSITSATFVVILLHMLLVVFYYIIFFQRELLWWLRIGFRPWCTVVCVGIFNLKHACATFLKVYVWTKFHRSHELKHFEWTCVSPHTLGKIDPMIGGA